MRAVHFFLATSFTLMACACVAPSKELMEKAYTWAELEELCSRGPKRCAKIDDKLYFIDEGFVFSYDSTGTKAYTSGYEVSEIVAYKNSPVALKTSGGVFLYASKESEWIEIGSNAKSIVSNDKHLVALTKNGEIWAYLGRPGEEMITWFPMTNFVNNVPIVTLIPMYGGREIAFEKVDIPARATGLGVDKGDIVIRAENLRLFTLNEVYKTLRCKTLAREILLD